MAQDISGLYISQSFQNLIQRSASGAFNVLATATGTEFIPISSSYAVSASRADSVLSASYALSSSYAVTASYAENATINTLQQVLTAGNTASLGFEVTGDARVNGKLIVSGSSNSVFDIDTFDLEITGGLDVSRDVAVRDDLTVYDDTTLRKDTSIGYRGDSPGFGYSLAVTQSINNSGSAKFIGDVQVTGDLNVTGSTTISGLTDTKGIFWNSGSYAAINGILYVGATSVGSSKSVQVGASNFQKRYGQMIINGNTDTYVGNNISEFVVADYGTSNNMVFGISSFTGAGNNIHGIKMGADQTLDASLANLKIYSSASSPDLNINADNTVFNDGGNITMSGSINLAGIGTGSSGQVIESGADGIAKWATSAAGGVTSIIAGTNVTISPVSGLGNVTINSSGGGGGTVAQQWLPTDYTQATAPGCDYVFATASIAAGTYAVGDMVEVRSMGAKTLSSGTTYITMAVSPGSITPGTGYPGSYKQIAGDQTGGNGTLYYQKTLYINSSTETRVWPQGATNESYFNGVAGGNPHETHNIDWTIDQTIWYGACIDNAGTRLENFGGTVRKLN